MIFCLFLSTAFGAAFDKTIDGHEGKVHGTIDIGYERPAYSFVGLSEIALDLI
jgi:hypothetical protein